MFPFLPALILLFLSGSSCGKGPADYAKLLDSIDALNVHAGNTAVARSANDCLTLCAEFLGLNASVSHPQEPAKLSPDAATTPAYTNPWVKSPAVGTSRTRDGPTI